MTPVWYEFCASLVVYYTGTCFSSRFMLGLVFSPDLLPFACGIYFYIIFGSVFLRVMFYSSYHVIMENRSTLLYERKTTFNITPCLLCYRYLNLLALLVRCKYQERIENQRPFWRSERQFAEERKPKLSRNQNETCWTESVLSDYIVAYIYVDWKTLYI